MIPYSRRELTTFVGFDVPVRKSVNQIINSAVRQYVYTGRGSLYWPGSQYWPRVNTGLDQYWPRVKPDLRLKLGLRLTGSRVKPGLRLNLALVKTWP